MTSSAMFGSRCGKASLHMALSLKQSHAADMLAFETCLEINEAMQQGYLTAGISYDIKKKL